MEHVIVRGVATAGKPAKVGNIGTITLETPLANGQIPYTFALDGRWLRRLEGRRRGRLLDKTLPKAQDGD